MTCLKKEGGRTAFTPTSLILSANAGVEPFAMRQLNCGPKIGSLKQFVGLLFKRHFLYVGTDPSTTCLEGMGVGFSTLKQFVPS